MRLFKGISFVNRLRVIIIGTSVIVLLLFAGIIIGYEVLSFRTSTVNSLSAVADVVSASAAPAVLFEDETYGERLLQTLSREKAIIAAAIFRNDGSLFASYSRDPVPVNAPLPGPRSPGYYFTPDNLEIFDTVMYEGELLGTISITYDLRERRARLVQYAAIISAIVLAASIVAFFIASRMQRMITEPVLHLAQIASTVTREKDYSIRAETRWTQDEVGRLAQDFNQMLERIEERDKDLERLVEERTRELRVALSELQKLDAMKTEFFASVSHELRTPLTSIIGFSKIMRKRIGEKILPRMENSDAALRNSIASMQEDLAIILSESARVTGMINNILDLTRLEEGAVAWKEELLIPAEIIEHSASAVRPLVREKGLALFVDIEDKVSTVLGDKGRLTQVMINLLANAVKFTSSGSVTCRLRRNAHEMVISVIDTGRGIAQEDSERIFEKYRQGTNNTGDGSAQGAGLGLSICKRIVEHYKGRIWVESVLGKGSAFSFSIPLHEQ